MGTQPTGQFVSRAPALGYTSPLDGLRGWAILAVLFVHASYLTFGSFVAGVDLFFVVSGFLITTLLLEEDRSAGAVSLRRFYGRRALRLLPLLYLTLFGTLAVVLLASAVVDTGDLLTTTWQDVAAGGLYVYHVAFPVHADEVVGRAPEIRPFIQLWSLSVEEHFYLFGVLVLIVAVRLRRVRELCAVFVAAWVAIGLARAAGHVGPLLAWYQRPDSLLLGVVLAFLNAELPTELSERARTVLRRGSNVAVGVLAVVLFVGTAFAKPFKVFVPFGPEVAGGSLSDGLHWGRFGFSVVAAASAWVVLSVSRVPDQWLARFLQWKPMVAVGKRSYALYLIHVPLGVVLVELLGDRAPALAVLLYFPLLIGLTEAAHRLVEKPAARWRTRLAVSSPTPSSDGPTAG
ncbi:MAG: acyltransferase family protein [Microthrixaceae bacterium]